MPTESLATWKDSLVNFTNLVGDIDAWNVDSPCPGWTIQELVSHTIDLETMLAADPRPDHTPNWDALTHISTDFGRLTEIGVDYRRSHSRGQLLTELVEAHGRAVARIESLSPDDSIPWLRGETPITTLLGMRSFDLWVHEQDARVAVEELGNLTGPGSKNALRYLVAGLPKVWGKKVSAPIGSVLQVHVVEPGLTEQVFVEIGEDGRAALVDDAIPTTKLTMPWLTFVMLGSGRMISEEMASTVSIDGDIPLGTSVRNAMAVTP